MSRLSAAARDYIAAAYVLGVLAGPARRAVQRRLRRDPDWQTRVRRWERHFDRLLGGFEPVMPSGQVWSELSRRANEPPPQPKADPETWLAPRKGQAPPAANEPVAPVAVPGRRGVSPLWRAWAVAASLLAVVSTAALLQPQYFPFLPRPVTVAQDPAPLYIGALTVDGGRWLVRGTAGGESVYIRVEDRPRVQRNRAAELWWIGADGTPRSMGLLPTQGEAQVFLDQPLPAEAPVFAVSIEPAGGSPTGLPTGPVVATFPAIVQR